MASGIVKGAVYGLKLSSVGPSRVTGSDVVHEPSNMDLAMKLHYLNGLYFFKRDAAQGLTIGTVKDAMFRWLDSYYITCGRFRRSPSGHPFIKCNDTGVRIIEAHCTMTIDEWLELEDYSLHKNLVYHQVIGPEIAFSPLVLMQLTWFKCGGISVGLSWAHVLGDAMSASNFLNVFGQIISGCQPNWPVNVPKSQNTTKSTLRDPENIKVEPLSVKLVEPVGDYWSTTSHCKMGTFSFQITEIQLSQLQSKISGRSPSGQIPPFECISSVIWQCLARIREGSEPRIVTICRNGSHGKIKESLSNNQTLSVVKTDFSVVEADLKDLAALIIEQARDERSQIEELMEKDQGLLDLLVYGANLTFVNLEEIDLYGFKLRGNTPVFANYTVDGVGDEGVIFVQPRLTDVKGKGNNGRTVTLTLPENQLIELRIVLKREWSIV